MQRFKELAEADGRPGMVRVEAGASFNGGKLRRHILMQVVRVVEITGAEVEPHDGMAHRPVPTLVDGEAPEQRLVALEQLLQGIHEQALAEAPRAGQEVVLSFAHQPMGIGGLVHVVPALLPDLAEGLDTDGQLALGGHGRTIAPASGGQSRTRRGALLGAFVQPGHAPVGGGERSVRAPGRPLRGDPGREGLHSLLNVRHPRPRTLLSFANETIPMPMSNAKLKFTRLRLRNWKNFPAADVSIQDRMFLVGPNASGKSNLLDAFRFLRDLASPGGGLREAGPAARRREGDSLPGSAAQERHRDSRGLAGDERPCALGVRACCSSGQSTSALGAHGARTERWPGNRPPARRGRQWTYPGLVDG